MLPSISFLVDESLPVDVAESLNSAGFEAIYVGASPLRGSTDLVLWQRAASDRSVIVTRDLDFPLPVEPRPVGLILVRVPDWFRKSQIKALVDEFLRDNDLQLAVGRVVVIAPGHSPRTRSLDTI